jgi:hypothetical protein
MNLELSSVAATVIILDFRLLLPQEFPDSPAVNGGDSITFKILHEIQHSPHYLGHNQKLLLERQHSCSSRRLCRTILVIHATILPNAGYLGYPSCNTYNISVCAM